MPHKPEDRDRIGICGAKTKSGKECRLFRGQGTDHKGYGHCRYHGGNSPNGKKYAAKLAIRERAAQYTETYDLSPVEALLWMVRLAAGQVRFLGEELSSTTDKSAVGHQIAVRFWMEERDRLARTSKMALDANVQERAVAVAEQIGSVVADVLRAVLYDPDLALNRAQRDRLPDLIRRHLTLAERKAVPALTAGTTNSG